MSISKRQRSEYKNEYESIQKRQHTEKEIVKNVFTLLDIDCFLLEKISTCLYNPRTLNKFLRINRSLYNYFSKKDVFKRFFAYFEKESAKYLNVNIELLEEYYTNDNPFDLYDRLYCERQREYKVLEKKNNLSKS